MRPILCIHIPFMEKWKKNNIFNVCVFCVWLCAVFTFLCVVCTENHFMCVKHATLHLLDLFFFLFSFFLCETKNERIFHRSFIYMFGGEFDYIFSIFVTFMCFAFSLLVTVVASLCHTPPVSLFLYCTASRKKANIFSSNSNRICLYIFI